MNVSRRHLLKAAALGSASLAAPQIVSRAFAAEPIKVGALYSQTGNLAVAEKLLANGVSMAVAEINAAGGVFGRPVEVVVEDGASDPKTFSEKASKLIVKDKIMTVFGCHTSASRKAVLPIFEKRGAMLFYQTHYEGFECSRNVIYSGAVPNHQLANYIPWIVKTLGKKKFFIVGSNYIYPREMAKVSKKLIEAAGAQWVADEYLELGHSEWAVMVKKIKESGADVVLSNVVGDSIIAFYREFKNQGISQTEIPICATVTSEIEIAAMGADYAAGSYTSFPYFMSLDMPGNKSFIERFRKFVNDPKQVTYHSLEAAYFQVFLWKQAVEKTKDLSAQGIRTGIAGESYEAPGGTVTIDADNLHCWLTPRIGQWQADGQSKVVDAYPHPIKPLPYFAYGETESNLFCTSKGLDTSKLKI
ncbi:urea transport system substrate-binding protein [Bradyrhizobium sp. USDA 4524]|uniref:transporter substrate-binding domain-containing protein n=1 Tax=unclassified Bradyrhizobium TaxID=2631580 RepID=UPI00209DBD38|nr:MULTISPECIES: transporter substrate-binding domain-containing protein [unclassified Bradyrhizobium]MCP1842829.1 urea transport system substrate-binding protein [Bradyrhizobium sp. USDA 4538]MCP1903394.1 urea transport system substrate-binding protein [Bradyrhizobium sp. USDA 4537]MCP1990949.1 urea transport system substrate-binding protein [Bradyrhizobium sp. USDA 4539]